jgi:hypothetical protein
VFAATSVAHAQADWCTKKTTADSIRVTLVDCPKQDQLTLRRRGDDRSRITLDPTGNSAVWVGEALDGSIDTNVLCSTLCNFASVCAAGKPSPRKDKDGITDICVANYEFRCAEQGWTLNVSWTPLVTLSYTRHRRRPDTDSVEQRGELKAREIPLAAITPSKTNRGTHSQLSGTNQICDLAADEEVKLKPNVKPYSFDDIRVSRADLEQKQNSWTLGANELMNYVKMPGGRRAQGASDAESAYVQQDLKWLTLTIGSERR